MGLLNELGIGRLNRALQRFCQIKNTQAAVPQLAPEIQPSIEMGSMPAEMRWLSGEKLGVFGNSTTANPATQSYAQIGIAGVAQQVVPVFGIVVVVEQIIISNPNAATSTQFDIGLSSVSTRAAQQAQTRDTRVNPNLAAFAMTARCTSGNDATGDGVAMLPQNVRLTVPANTTIIIPGEWIICLAPSGGGRALTVRAVDVNETFDCTFFFRERALEESEAV